MILYLSSNENMGLLDYLIDDKKLVIKKLSGEFNLNKFVIHDMRNLSHCTQIIIDLKAVTDTEEEIINAITAFKAIYNARIVILAEELNSREELLRKLIDIEVYNLVTAETIEDMRKEIEQCIIGEGMTYQDCLKFMVDIDTGDTSKFRFKGKNIKIVVAGVMHRIGTTTTAMNLANYLAGIGAKVCYVENNTSGHLRAIAMFYDELVDKGNYYKFKGVRYYNHQRIDQAYDFIVHDLGVLTYNNIQLFRKNCINILCCGCKPYELRELYYIGELVIDINIGILISNKANRAKEKIENLLNDLNDKYYYLENSTDLFNNAINNDIFYEILKEYIEII